MRMQYRPPFGLAIEECDHRYVVGLRPVHMFDVKRNSMYVGKEASCVFCSRIITCHLDTVLPLVGGEDG